MLKRLQLKLLSPTGELLNVVTCHGGQVTVFRANSPADLRPYQRALSGSPGKERFSINVDGAEYSAGNRVIVGLGEDPPHSGLTVRELFAHSGLSESSSQALLTSYGLDVPLSTSCASLSQDFERRIRLLIATCDPTKAVILNEPFENIGSQWRERFAELLTNFARLKGGLVIVTALSYRPENWIDNEVVARVQVGTTLQRTIGFGGSSSESTNLMNQIRDMVREDPTTRDERLAEVAPIATVGVSAALMTAPQGAQAELHSSAHTHSPLLSGLLSKSEPLVALVAAKPLLAGIVLSTFGTGLIYYSLFSGSPRPQDSATPATALLAPTNSDSHADSAIERAASEIVATPPKQDLPSDVSSSSAIRAEADVHQQNTTRVPSILDGYTEVVRVSLLETARGSIPSESGESEAETQPPITNGKNTGNLFKLLESAGSSGNERSLGGEGNEAVGDYQEPPPPPPTEWTGQQDSSDSSNADASEEQQRREAIRQKFLEAIRAAAEKRQGSMDDTGM